ncbi:MAG: hypothetical protein IJ087_09505 [Eggerthellaceae bacterium]|nr:hypothetical protein [Eggerthellaceae bacterium]
MEPTEQRKSGSVVWRCRCDCGNEVEVSARRLKLDRTKSCGCLTRVQRGEDLAGQRFGKLVAVRQVGNRRGHALWECACDCGNTTEVTADVLKSGRTKSCGCLYGPGRSGGRVDDLTGRRFGKLVVRQRVGSRGTYALWECACDCGNICQVTSHDLKHNGTSSCGCARKRPRAKDIAGERFGKLYAVNPVGRSDRGSAVWRCLCDCDRVVEVSVHDLKSGKASSCGECG